MPKYPDGHSFKRKTCFLEVLQESTYRSNAGIYEVVYNVLGFSNKQEKKLTN